ncbi:MAG: hypothetical protein ICV55_15870 [Coleofasciculus sp. C3-bin4]|nr:hypothetical protein [Coleofasciculus sp. C3-bin4]
MALLTLVVFQIEVFRVVSNLIDLRSAVTSQSSTQGLLVFLPKRWLLPNKIFGISFYFSYGEHDALLG